MSNEAAAKQQQPIQFLLKLLSLWFYWRKSESEHKFWQSKKPKKSLEFALFFFFFSPEFEKKMRPKRNSDEQRSLTQKTNCCLIYFQICRTKRQRSSPYNFYFSCFLYGFIGGKASQNTSFDSQKSQRSPWNLLCSSSPAPQSLNFFYVLACYILATTTIYVQICIKTWCHFFISNR